MKNTLLLTIFTGSVLFASAQDKVFNDSHAQKRSVSGFHGVEISSGVDLYLSQGSDDAVAVSADDAETRDRILTEVSGGILRIYIDHSKFPWFNWNHKHLKAYVSARTIDLLRASGGSDVYIQDELHGDHLRIDLSGGSDMRGRLGVSDVTITQSGGSDAYLSGTAGSLLVHTSGGSDFHGYDLAADNCRVEASGGSDAYVRVNRELTAHASGGSDVHYKGSGVLKDSQASGSGSISHKD